ncbi:protein yippee-like At5g53940 isoform X2 [Ricinus communis]|uniref:protein yippee-like At5g53940 isoform X2 n=1 Tax=Ricinus communis TaxID=3988 RepID=UPI00201AACCE|nr:protein yippee-like At5g53940 isoform X2 [Ricinus communis]
MGRLFVVDVEGRCYSCRFCDTPLALADDVLSRGEHNCWAARGEDDAFRHAYCGGYLLLLLWTTSWLEIPHDKSQKYKEGKFVLERWRIDDEASGEFNLDGRPSSNDGENH